MFEKILHVYEVSEIFKFHSRSIDFQKTKTNQTKQQSKQQQHESQQHQQANTKKHRPQRRKLLINYIICLHHNIILTQKYDLFTPILSVYTNIIRLHQISYALLRSTKIQ